MLRDALVAAAALPSSSLRAKGAWFRQLLAWERRVLAEDIPLFHGTPDVTAVVLSYRRPQNIRPIVRMLLRLPQIRRVVISNNNPRTAFPVRLGLRDPRVHVVQQPIDRSTAYRFSLAALDDAPKFLFVDDDLFLTPLQANRLITELEKDPSVPHGIIGQIYDSWMDRMHHNVRDHEGPVDVMNCVYAFTREHINEFFRLAESLPIRLDSPIRRSSAWDDLLASRTGASRPRLHRVGTLLLCPTSGMKNIAASAEDEFFRFRIRFFKRLLSVKPL